jgi:hypothetical protein
MGRLFIVAVNWVGGGCMYFAYFFIKHLALKGREFQMHWTNFTLLPLLPRCLELT